MTTSQKPQKLEKLLQYGDGNPNEAVQAWKQAGKKVFGYWCSYIPSELFHAAGALPYRVRGCGATGTDKADKDMSPVCNCSFPRAVLDIAHNGGYDFLDGIVGMNSCDHSRRAFEIWVERLHPSFHHFVYVPRTQKEISINEYVHELEKLKSHLEERLGVEITAEALGRTVELYNENRVLLRQVQELFEKDHPPLTGTQRHQIINASVCMPPEEFNGLLKEALVELQNVTSPQDDRVRIMLAGWVGDDTLLHRVVEESGGLVVMDNCCFGARAFWQQMSFDPARPLESLARFYLSKTSCPRMFATFDERFGMLKDAISDYRVDGIIRTRLQFCDLHGLDNVHLHKRRDTMGVPMSSPLVLDYVGQDEGRLRTRVAAFIEQLKQ